MSDICPVEFRDAVDEAEKEAKREIDAALVLGRVHTIHPGFGETEDVWFEAVYGVTKRELEEIAEIAREEFYADQRWYRRDSGRQRKARMIYIRAKARLTVSMGLQTVWR